MHHHILAMPIYLIKSNTRNSHTLIYLQKSELVDHSLWNMLGNTYYCNK